MNNVREAPRSFSRDREMIDRIGAPPAQGGMAGLRSDFRHEAPASFALVAVGQGRRHADSPAVIGMVIGE